MQSATFFCYISHFYLTNNAIWESILNILLGYCIFFNIEFRHYDVFANL